MKVDRFTQVLLLAIALGLWGNLLKPVVVHASDEEQSLKDIAHDVHAIYSGVCINTAICH